MYIYIQGSTYLSATLCWVAESIYPNKFSQPRTIYFLQLLKIDLSETTISQVQPKFIYSNLAALNM